MMDPPKAAALGAEWADRVVANLESRRQPNAPARVRQPSIERNLALSAARNWLPYSAHVSRYPFSFLRRDPCGLWIESPDGL